MTWNKEKIEKILNDLQRRILTVKEEPLLTTLQHDYKTLIDALKFVDTNTYEQYKDFCTFSSSIHSGLSDFKVESATAFLENREKTTKIQRMIEEKSLKTTRLMFFRKIPIDIQVEMAREFFWAFDNDHFLLLEDLLKDNICFTNKKSDIPDALGKCHFISSLQESFIIVDSRGGKKVTTLPHEIAHAFEFSILPDFHNQMNWYFSSFVECYPRFIEFLFIDYFIDGKYKHILAELKRNFFDCLKVTVENYYSILHNLEDYDVLTNRYTDRDGNGYYKKNVDYIISDLLAIYMFNLYKNNRDEYEKFILKYHSFKGKSDKEIWELIKGSDVEKAFSQEYLVLMRNLRAKKK